MGDRLKTELDLHRAAVEKILSDQSIRLTNRYESVIESARRLVRNNIAEDRMGSDLSNDIRALISERDKSLARVAELERENARLKQRFAEYEREELEGA